MPAVIDRARLVVVLEPPPHLVVLSRALPQPALQHGQNEARQFRAESKARWPRTSLSSGDIHRKGTMRSVGTCRTVHMAYIGIVMPSHVA